MTRVELVSLRSLLIILALLMAWAMVDRCDRRGDRFWITDFPAAASTDELAHQVFHEALHEDGQLELRHRLGPRMSAHTPPVQENLPSRIDGWERAGFRFHPRAAYGVEARVLATQTYRADELAPVVPIDFALGWGPMTNPDTYDQLGIRISRRFYSYRWRGRPPIPVDDIALSSANKHLIPATPEVEAVLRRARKDDWVRLYGYLVDVQRPDGFIARTSMVRNDRGAGACENIWVTHAEIIHGPSPRPTDAPDP